VIVTVVAVRMMKMAADAVVRVIAVRHRLMATAGAVDVARVMTAAAVVGSAAVGVLARYLDRVLVDMIFVRMVKVTIVQIVYVATVAHGRVSAARSMLVSVVGVGWGRASRHGIVSFPCSKTADTAVRLSAAWSMALRTNGSTCSSARA
jgi:hypothetical protein